VIEVRLDKPGHKTSIQRIEVADSDSRTVTLQLAPEGGILRLEGLPRGASVYLDDVVAEDREPLTISLGQHKIRVESRGEVVFAKTIEVQPGEQTINVRASAGR
jgi:hypothetical protein